MHEGYDGTLLPYDAARDMEVTHLTEIREQAHIFNHLKRLSSIGIGLSHREKEHGLRWV